MVAGASLREVQLYLVLFVEDIGLPVKKNKKQPVAINDKFCHIKLYPVHLTNIGRSQSKKHSVSCMCSYM